MSTKKLLLITAPVTSRSGYGDHARDLARAFMYGDKYDVKIFDVRWGDCPRNALDANNPRDIGILNNITLPEQMDKNYPGRKPDIYVDIRIPNEFQQIGAFNIGVTAGIETNMVSGKWIEHCNKMDLCIVPSNHSKDMFVKSVYDAVQQMPDGSQQKVGELKLEKPMEVLFEGVDTDVFKPLDTKDIPKEFLDWIDEIAPEEHAFLFTGLWGTGTFGEDRKDIFTLIKNFYETFANKKKQPSLILKTSGAGFSLLGGEEIKRKVRSVKRLFPSDTKLPNVYLLHGSLTETEMNYLYNHPKIKAMVSLTHGEGFGRPLLEATMVGLPVIAPNWSGQIDFLKDGCSILLGGDIEKVPKSAHWQDIILPESSWFYVNQQDVCKSFAYTFDNSQEFREKAKKLMEMNRNEFSLQIMTDKLHEILDNVTGDMPTLTTVKLPKLNRKEEQPELPKIKIPKLKKLK